MTCEGELGSNRLIGNETGSTWFVTGSVVKTKVVHYDEIKANEIIDSVRKLISCGSYVETWSEGTPTVTVHGEVETPEQPEADGQISWCETVSPTFARCYGLVTRGEFASVVLVATANVDKAKGGLGDTLPIVAKALGTVG